MSPKSYMFRVNDYPQINVPHVKNFGLIAQELERIIPELVKKDITLAVKDTSGNIIYPQIETKGINYIGLIPFIIAGVNEQQAQIDSQSTVISNQQNAINQQQNQLVQQQTQLAQQQTQIDSLYHAMAAIAAAVGISPTGKTINPVQGNLSTKNIELTNDKSIILNQNEPNPFAENTVIKYFIPEEINFAQIIFSDNFGRIIKTVDIEKSGYGEIKVYSEKLSDGIYTYSIIIDGKAIDTKKMLKAK